MLDFMQGDFDVLISTSIVESGLDIPNANTIIINNGHQFGLSDLHQLRGRVGRSNKKAFCYIFAPPITLLSPESHRRLKAVEEFSALGSGLNIALQDLDIGEQVTCWVPNRAVLLQILALRPITGFSTKRSRN